MVENVHCVRQLEGTIWKGKPRAVVEDGLPHPAASSRYLSRYDLSDQSPLLKAVRQPSRSRAEVQRSVNAPEVSEFGLEKCGDSFVVLRDRQSDTSQAVEDQVYLWERETDSS